MLFFDHFLTCIFFFLIGLLERELSEIPRQSQGNYGSNSSRNMWDQAVNLYQRPTEVFQRLAPPV